MTFVVHKASVHSEKSPAAGFARLTDHSPLRPTTPRVNANGQALASTVQSLFFALFFLALPALWHQDLLCAHPPVQLLFSKNFSHFNQGWDCSLHSPKPHAMLPRLSVLSLLLVLFHGE